MKKKKWIKNDPLGEALMNYYLTGKEAVIHVHSEEVESYDIPVSLLFRDYQTMPLIEQQAIHVCRGRILDIGAGAGCHALYLQQQGADVEALDISPKACDVMKQMGVRTVHTEDIFGFNPETRFETLLMLMNGIGLCGTLNNFRKLLKHFKKLLNTNGQIIFDTSDIIYLYEHEPFNLNTGKYYGEITYQMVFEDVRSAWFEWLYIDAGTLQDLAGEEGYSCEILYEGEHYDYLVRLKPST